jgi:hypothetical protein
MAVIAQVQECTFSTESWIRGCHVYQHIWNAVVGERLLCIRERGNIHDLYAVAVTDVDDNVVGHVPRSISYICSLFFLRGRRIKCEVAGDRRYYVDLAGERRKICLSTPRRLKVTL